MRPEGEGPGLENNNNVSAHAIAYQAVMRASAAGNTLSAIEISPMRPKALKLPAHERPLNAPSVCNKIVGMRRVHFDRGVCLNDIYALENEPREILEPAASSRH